MFVFKCQLQFKTQPRISDMAIAYDIVDEVITVVLLTLIYFFEGPVTFWVNFFIITDVLDYLWPRDVLQKTQFLMLTRLF